MTKKKNQVQPSAGSPEVQPETELKQPESIKTIPEPKKNPEPSQDGALSPEQLAVLQPALELINRQQEAINKLQADFNELIAALKERAAGAQAVADPGAGAPAMAENPLLQLMMSYFSQKREPEQPTLASQLSQLGQLAELKKTLESLYTPSGEQSVMMDMGRFVMKKMLKSVDSSSLADLLKQA